MYTLRLDDKFLDAKSGWLGLPVLSAKPKVFYSDLEEAEMVLAGIKQRNKIDVEKETAELKKIQHQKILLENRIAKYKALLLYKDTTPHGEVVKLEKHLRRAKSDLASCNHYRLSQKEIDAMVNIQRAEVVKIVFEVP